MPEERQDNFVNFKLAYPGARILFANVVSKKVLKIPGSADKEQWDATLAFPANHEELLPLKTCIVTVLREGNPSLDYRDPRNWSKPWESGDDFIARADKKYDNSWLSGMTLFKAHATKHAPRISYFDARSGKLIQCTDDAMRPSFADKFYKGCEVYGEFGVKYYPPVGRNGLPSVTLYLNSLISLMRGEKLAGGAPSHQESFGEYLGRLRQDDPYMGHNPADDIPY